MPEPEPILAAVEQAVREQITAWWQTPPRLDLAADVAVTAHRRAVLDQRDDGPVARIQRQYEQRRRLIAQGVNFGNASIATTDEDVGALLAALADETIARRQAETDRDVLVRVRDEAVGKTADYAQALRDVVAERDRLAVFATGCAEEIGRVREKAAALLDGELAHRSRDYGRGVAQATRDILAALDGEESH